MSNVADRLIQIEDDILEANAGPLETAKLFTRLMAELVSEGWDEKDAICAVQGAFEAVQNEPRKEFTPDWSVHPSEILSETVELLPQGYKGILDSGLPFETMVAILNYKQDITPDIAKHLENGTGVEASFWLNLQKNYDEHTRIGGRREQGC